jgi:hypothetical protein
MPRLYPGHSKVLAPGLSSTLDRRARNPFVSFALKIDLEKLRPRQE